MINSNFIVLIKIHYYITFLELNIKYQTKKSSKNHYILKLSTYYNMYKTFREDKEELAKRLTFILVIVTFLLLLGAVVYHYSEGWSMLDSIYFATISLTSRGYSLMRPTHWVSVLFSIFYLLIGAAVMIYTISTLIAFYSSFFQKKVEGKLQSFVTTIKDKTKEKPDSWMTLKPWEKKERKWLFLLPSVFSKLCALAKATTTANLMSHMIGMFTTTPANDMALLALLLTCSSSSLTHRLHLFMQKWS